MAKLRFWTPQEVETLMTVVKSEKLRTKGIEKYAKQSGRTVKAVAFKFYHHKDQRLKTNQLIH